MESLLEPILPWAPRPLRRFVRSGRSTLTLILFGVLCILLFTLFATSQLNTSITTTNNRGALISSGNAHQGQQGQQGQLGQKWPPPPAPPLLPQGKESFKHSNDEEADRNRPKHIAGGARAGVKPLPLKPESWEKNLLNQPAKLNEATHPPEKAFEAVPSDMKDYPILTPKGNFIPVRRWVHLDLKGAPYKPAFFFQLFAFFRRININGVLLEWEEMFPYTGVLASAVNGNAYTLEQINAILDAAKEMQLEVTPLIQTFGHLEWMLKLEQFVKLREDPKYPQVICFGAEESWALLKEMIDQVAKVHGKHGMRFFHVGADEAFHIGVCNATLREMQRQGGHDRVILWHLARTARYIKETYGVTVLAWHDMFSHSTADDLAFYNMTKVLEPVLWSYAEDLEEYLPYSNWEALKPFGNVWGSSAFKGADGPHRFNSNPIHYIRNQESWTVQMTRVYKDFKHFQGLIITGWSRYDAMAVLTELIPVALPTLVMCVETILAGLPLKGAYPKTSAVLHCTPNTAPGYTRGCSFPGSRIYELINEYSALRDEVRKYADKDHELNGWLSNMAQKYQFSSGMYLEKIMPLLDYHLTSMERLEKDLRLELGKIYFPDTTDEFVLTYMSPDMDMLRDKFKAAESILKVKTFPKRPFIKHPSTSEKDTVRIIPNRMMF